MMKKWKNLMAAVCTASMLVTMPGMGVLADELSEDELIVSVAEDPEETAEVVDSPSEEMIESEDFPSETIEGTQDVLMEEDMIGQDVPESVGEDGILVGDNVFASFNADTGAVELISYDGKLGRDWVERLGVSRSKIKSIKVTSGIVYLPANSSGAYISSYSKMYYLFGGLFDLTSLDLSGFDTSNVKDMSDMFSGCSRLTSLDLSGFDTSNVKDMSDMFSDCSRLTSLDLRSFDTSNVTRMNNMFNGCSSLTNLDLSHFSTSNVTYMRGMFNGCSSLTSLDLSGFDTWNVSDIQSMFEIINTIQSIKTPKRNRHAISLPIVMSDESGHLYGTLPTGSESVTLIKKNGIVAVGDNVFASFDADTGAVELISYDGELWSDWIERLGVIRSTVKSIEVISGIVYLPADSKGKDYRTYYLFGGLSGLISLDLSSFDTSRVKDMSNMFDGCSSLTSLDLSSFDMTNVVNASYMLNHLYALQCLKTPKNNSNAISLAFIMRDEFGHLYNNLPTGSESVILTKESGFVEVGNNVFASFDVDTGAVELVSFEGELWRDWVESLGVSRNAIKSIKVSSGIVYLPHASYKNDYECIFGGLGSLTSLDLSSFDTSRVENMSLMFSGCSSLSNLDLSGFDTSNVTDMCYMFSGCGSLNNLDLSSFDTSNVTDMRYMFSGCSSLTNLDLSSFDMSKVTVTRDMFNDCYRLDILKTPTNNTIVTTLQAVMNDESGHLYGTLPTGSESIILTKKDGVVAVGDDVFAYFDPDTEAVDFISYDGELWFDWSTRIGVDKSEIKSINVVSGTVYLPTDACGTYDYMYACSSFGGLSGLTNLDLSNFDTSRVEDMSQLFIGCSRLTSLDLSGFDTSNVKDMSNMFSGCSRLTSLNLSGFDTSNVKDMSDMFSGCSRLTSLNLSGFDTSSVNDMSAMFSYCSKLTSLDLSSFDTSNVKDMSAMFSDCSILANFDLSNFDTSKVEDMSYMFSNCSSLTSLDLSSFDISSVKNVSYMFSGCSKLNGLNLNSFDTSSVNDMSAMFSGCSGITSMNLSSFDTSNVASMSSMFSHCDSLSSLNLSNFNTSKVKDMSDMFLSCSSLPSLNLSNFNTSKVKDMSDMFLSCSSLSSLNLSGFNTSNVENMSLMFCGCSSLPSLDLSSFDTSNVEKMDSMFKQCSSLPNLDLSSFDTSNVTDMHSMFSSCSSLPNLDLSSFDTSNVTDMYDMFSGCSSLTRLDLSGIDTSKVTEMAYMFNNCSSLTSLNLSSFDTSNVWSTGMDNMFEGCSNLTSLDLSGFDTSNVWSIWDFLDGCKKLHTLKTPKKNTKEIDLPVTMYDESGKGYSTLPMLSKSIVLTRKNPVVTPTPMPTKSGFSDVQDPKHAYYKAIYWAAGEGITKGYSDGTFGINRSCTRGEMMMFLWRYAGKPAPKNVSTSPFKDVPKTHTFYKAILWGSQKGITKGYPDGTFGVNRNVSRGECMMFLWRLKGKPAPKAVAKAPFPDVPKSHVFYNAVLWGFQKKIRTGYTSGDKKGTQYVQLLRH